MGFLGLGLRVTAWLLSRLLIFSDMVDEHERILPFTSFRKRLSENVRNLFKSVNINHSEVTLLKLLLQPCKRKLLSSIGVAELLAVAFQNDCYSSLVVFKNLHLELIGQNERLAHLCLPHFGLRAVTRRSESHQVLGQFSLQWCLCL